MRSTSGGIGCRSRRIHGSPASACVTAAFPPQARQHAQRMRERGAGRPSEPCGPHRVAGRHARACVRVALHRRVMMNRQVRRIHEPRACAIQVEREQCFLAAEEVARMIAAGLHERVAPKCGRTGQQPEDRAPRQRDVRIQRAVGHQPAGRVFALFRADQHARGDGRDVRIRIEQVRGFGERAGRPPRVVVAERDVARARDGHAEIAAGRAEIGRRMHERHVREAVAHERGGIVVRAVVDDDDRGPVGQVGQPRERAREFRRAPVGQHDRGHARFARRQRDSRRRYADTWPHSSRQYVSGSRRSARI